MSPKKELMPQVEIKEHRGQATLHLDNQPHFFGALWLMQKRKETWLHQKEVSMMSDAGVKLFSWFIRFPDAPENGKYDFDYCLDNIELALEENPDAYIALKPDIDAPLWWQEKYPEELERIAYIEGSIRDQREFQSYASEVWLKDVQDMLTQMIRAIKSKPYGEKVIAILPCAGGAGEWMQGATVHPGDYSKPMQSHFAKWLEKKYQSPAELARAWGKDIADFSKAYPPTPERYQADVECSFRDPQADADFIDYLECTDELLASCVEGVCRAVVEAAEGTMISGTYFDKSAEGYWPIRYWNLNGTDHSRVSMLRRAGNGGIMKVLRSPWVHAIAAPYSYQFRAVGGTGEYMQLSESGRLHGKLVIFEDDNRTPLSPIPEGEYGKPANNAEAKAQLVRNFGTVLTKSSALWWGYPWTPEASKGIWSDPEIRGCVSRLLELGRFQTEHIEKLGSTADIAVIVDTDSERYLAGDYSLAWSSVIRQRIWELSRMGAPYDTYHMDDLVEGRLSAYKFVIFLRSYATDAERTRKTHEYLKQHSATALWLYAAGYVDRDAKSFSHDSMRKLTGITTRSYPLAWNPTMTLTHYDHAITKDLPEHLSWTSTAPFGPVMSAEDPDAKTLATCTHVMGKCEPGLVTKALDGWNSVWCAMPYIPAKLLREIARTAGVHIWSERDEVMTANHNWLMLHSLKGGNIEVQLPENNPVVDAMTGEACEVNGRTLLAKLEPRSTRLFYHGQTPFMK